LEPNAKGRIHFQGEEITTLRGRRARRVRRAIQILFSNPYIAFAPRMTVEEIISEALGGGHWFKRRQDERLADLMALAGLNPYLSVRFPRELSGGSRLRLALARALAADPALLICDQPVNHVDPAMGQVIIELLDTLCRRMGLTMLLTLRQLRMARHADRVAVMVLGRIVEMGYYADLVYQPLHPFTKALLQSGSRDYPNDVGALLDPQHPPPGCHFAPACPVAETRCHESYPSFVAGAPNHGVACHLVEPMGELAV
jgi:oligopeptide/dipeptide ABC transporter ATP-binding protein